MKRNEWTFQYYARDLYSAAKKKCEHHAERHTWWQDQREKTIKKIKAEGLSFDESLASIKGGMASNTYSRQPTVTVEQTLLNDLYECNNKISEHRSKYAQYFAWKQILAEQSKTLDLTHDDWLFFFRENTIDKPGVMNEEFDE